MGRRGTDTKKPKKNIPIPNRRQVRTAKDDVQSKTIVWSLSYLDDDCKWGWRAISGHEFWTAIYPKLKSFESMEWKDFRGDVGHFIKTKAIIKDARDRLQERDLDDHEDLFRLRLSGKRRLWGIRDERVFRALWYDPEHEICPSKKKHT